MELMIFSIGIMIGSYVIMKASMVFDSEESNWGNKLVSALVVLFTILSLVLLFIGGSAELTKYLTK